MLQKDGVMAMRYIDKKDIILMATAHSFKPKKTLGNENEAQEIIQKPEVVMEYNKYMKGVDQVDQYLAFYSFNRKTVKWWKRATTMIHMARVQAHIIPKKANAGKPTMSLVDFTLCLISCLLADVAEENRSVQVQLHEL